MSRHTNSRPLNIPGSKDFESKTFGSKNCGSKLFGCKDCESTFFVSKNLGCKILDPKTFDQKMHRQRVAVRKTRTETKYTEKSAIESD